MQPANAAIAYERLTDLELAQRVASGDKRAFELLMRRHNQILYRTARSILKDDAEAEDAVQEAWLLAYRAIGNFRGDAKLSTWLVRIVVNEAISRGRKRSRGAEVIQLSGETQEDGGAVEENVNRTLPEQPEHAAQRAQTRRLLEAKIDELPDTFRTVFVLRALEELSVEESAVALDIPEATVRSRFFRARGLLREALSKEIDLAYGDAFAFAGARCDRIVAGVLARLEENEF
ncbi:MAG TPA: RNA polymerase sigma factor [Burkholderiales bacterium]|nr:RNA polymerase sigma factor [Burkholderiales bacterium]